VTTQPDLKGKYYWPQHASLHSNAIASDASLDFGEADLARSGARWPNIKIGRLRYLRLASDSHKIWTSRQVASVPPG
jgi:hypothetical protein